MTRTERVDSTLLWAVRIVGLVILVLIVLAVIATLAAFIVGAVTG